MIGVLGFVGFLSAVMPVAQAGGVVQTAGGAPIVGAAVVVVGTGAEARTIVTDEGGRFDLSGIELPATIEVRAPGFASVRRRIESAAVTIVLVPSPIRESVIVSSASMAVDWRRPETGTTTLDAETLRALPGVTMDETLRAIAGLSLFRRSSSRTANPTTHGVTMRGLSASGASRGLVLFEGVPLADGFGGWVTWTRLPPLAVGAVDIDRGAQGTTFGSDALGGVIDVTAPRDGSPVADLALGSDGTSMLDVWGGRRVGPVALAGAGSWFRTDGTIPVAPESRGAVDVPTDARWTSAYGRVAWAPHGHRLTMSGWGSEDDRGNGTVLQRNRTAGGTFAAAWEAMVRGAQVAARLSVSPNDYMQTFSAVASGRATETLTSTQFIDTTATRAVVEAGRPVPSGYVAARVSLSRTSADFTNRLASSTIMRALRDDAESVSVHGAWHPSASVTLGAGARHEWRAAPELDTARETATVGHVNGAWRLSPRVVVRGSVASSHRWPTLNELVRNFQVGSVLTLANAALAPERARSADAAVSVSGDDWSVSAGGFWTVVEDAIANVTQSAGPPIVRRRENAGEAHARGLEIDADARLGTRAGARVSVLVVDARFRESAEPALEGNWLPQVPRASVSLSGFVRPRPWLLAAATWRGLSSQFDDDRNVFTLGAARQLDVRVAATGGVWTVHATVDNALDARVEVGRTPLVTLAPGRAVRVGILWRR